MRRAIDRFGWGAGPQDTAPPIDGPQAEHVRALAYWLFLQAGSRQALDLSLHGLFQRPSAELPEGERVLANLFALLQRLLHRELPALTRSVRVETTHVATWMRAPHGGRVDVVASLRASAGARPEQWRVQRVERNIETPVNRFAAAVLRAAAARVAEVGGLYRRRGLHVPDLLVDAGVGLRRFLREHPLGSIAVPPGLDPEDYWRAAARRATELRRIRSLVQWWEEIQKIELVVLHELFAAGGRTLAELSVHSVYEMMVALALVCALSMRLRSIESPDAEVLRFAGNARTIDLRFGASGPHAKMRGFTASMTVARIGVPPVTTLIDARNCHPGSLPVYAAYLESICRMTACAGLLISPGPAVPPDSAVVRWVAMPADPDVPALMRRWLDVLELDLP